ncbi:hypothetical protein [Bacillus swezeyi]|uniref:hypothetical protein n=1 Tax=Bacillus swezeyi TaxID=1925020 RepID=UPI003F897059
MKKIESDKSTELVEYYEAKLKKLFSIRKQLKDYLKQENTKIQEVVVCDDMLVEYPYYIRTKKGGGKYWKAALKFYIKPEEL